MDCRQTYFASNDRALWAPGSLGLVGAAVLVLYGTSLLTVRLGSNRVLTYHEVVFAQPAKEMLASGDWLIPTMGGQVFPDKPPLMHWAVAASMFLFQSEAEWAVRLPSVISAMAIALVIAVMAARWNSPRVGLFAGLVQITCYYVLMQARLAEADMLLCLNVCAAMACFVAGSVASRPSPNVARWHRRGFFVFAALAFMTKGPIGLAFVFGGVGGYLLLSRSKESFRFIFDPVGWSLFLAGVMIWPLSAYVARPEIWEGWVLHNWDRFRGTMGPSRPPWFYAYIVPLLLLPWTPFVVIGVADKPSMGGLIGDRKKFIMFLASWFVVGFAVISLSAWKHKHYAIPILPPLSIYAGIGLERCIFGSWFPRVRVRTIATLCLWAGLGTVFVVGMLRPELTILAGFATFTVIVGATLAAVLITGGRIGVATGVVFAAIWIVAALVLSAAMPFFDSYRDQTEFARRVNEVVPSDVPVLLVGVGENQITYYVRPPWQRIDDAARFLRRRDHDRREAFVLGPQRILDAVISREDFVVLDRCDSLRKHMTDSDRLVLIQLTGRRPGRLRETAAR
jgi:4-amino-4-deoxy-L-arabinose transferase-like glycosyltransferase